MSEPRVNSVLAVDFGSVNTRALLLDRVDGVYRLVGSGAGRTTIGPNERDVYVGLTSILKQMSEATGRRFLDDAGGIIRPEQADRVGVDYVATTVSAGKPLRAVLVGLYPQVSIAASRRAIAPFYIDVVAEAHLEDGLGVKGRLNRIIQSRPQLIVITGGADGGARGAMQEMIALAREAVALMPQGRKATVLYAGNSSLATSAREMLSQQVEVLIAPNIWRDGAVTLKPAQAVLGRYFDGVMRRGKGFQRSALISDSGFVPTARSQETMTAFFARSLNQGVLTIDIGSAQTMLSLGRKGAVQTAIGNDIGLGHSAASALERIGEEAVMRWLPFHPRKGELAQYARNKGLRPASEPLDMRERYIEYALLRASIRFMRSNLSQLARPPVGLVILAGAIFSGAGPGALDLLLLADALELDGAVQVWSDPVGALPALGTLAAVEPEAVVQLVDGQALQEVGTLVRVSGRARAGATAVRVTARRDDGEVIERDIGAGDVWHLPVASGKTFDLRIQASRGLSVGGKRRLRLRLRSGRGGLLIDARLDAQASAKSMTERAVAMLRWYAAVTGQESPVAIPESWLAAERQN
ncbi:MAG: glutamate mutase L [Chloroflexota bacterium]|nr:glutamate mutase L [Chloroflexota bacterium]MDE2910494.1 glutamate mutase L [Chloroflexota bacterium]